MCKPILFGLGLALIAGRAETVVVRPVNEERALVNPGMGWTFHFYSNVIGNYGSRLEPSDTLEDWPGLAVIYLRVPWSFLEPEEGCFNWSLFDTPAQRWIARGRRIALRVSSTESWLRWATPEWVSQAGAKGLEFEFGKGPKPGGPLWEPDYLDPVFLAKLDRFLAVLAARYDGNPTVDFIDIGSFGMWGEGHTGFSSRLSEEQTLAVARRHIDLHAAHFKKTQLCISDDVAGAGKPGRDFPVMDYARSKGVSLRDDSILVQPPPKSWYHAEMAEAFWPTLPVILEHEHFGPSKQRGAWDGALWVKSVEDYHASYMSIHWWPRELLQENRSVVDQINRRLGYRLELRELRHPTEVRVNEPFAVTVRWANTGVAPCLPGGHWALTFKDPKAGLAAVLVQETFEVRSLPPGPVGQARERVDEARFILARRLQDPRGTFGPPLAPGDFDVFVSVGRRDGTPVFELPLAGDDGHRRYRVSRIRVGPPRATDSVP